VVAGCVLVEMREVVVEGEEVFREGRAIKSRETRGDVVVFASWPAIGPRLRV